MVKAKIIMKSEGATCHWCGDTYHLRYYEGGLHQLMSALKVCAICAQWEQFARKSRSSSSIRVNGVLFIIRGETLRTRTPDGVSMYGHAFRMKNGKMVFTTNLACFGKIPQRFRSRLPDNAMIIEEDLR